MGLTFQWSLFSEDNRASLRGRVGEVILESTLRAFLGTGGRKWIACSAMLAYYCYAQCRVVDVQNKVEALFRIETLLIPCVLSGRFLLKE